jgi:hypothetical protein
MSNRSMQRSKKVLVLWLACLFCLSGGRKDPSDARHLRRRLLENDIVSTFSSFVLSSYHTNLRLIFLFAQSPSSPPGDLFFTQPPSSSPVKDDQFDGSISAEDAIPALIIGVASSVILCAVFLFVTDLRDRCRHERLLEEREQQRQQRREMTSLKKVERTVSSEIISSTPSSMSVPIDQPEYVEKVSESSVSTMTSLGCLRAAVSEDLDHSLEVTALTDSHRVSQGTDISSLVEVSKIQASNLPFYKDNEIESTSLKSLEGDCTASPISSVMKYVDRHDEEGGDSCWTSSPVTSFDVSEISFGDEEDEEDKNDADESNGPEKASSTFGESPCSSPGGSHQSAQEMSTASSIKSVESSADHNSNATEPSMSQSQVLESPSIHIHGIPKASTTSPSSFGSPSISCYATPQAPKSPTGSVKSWPDLAYGTPMQSPLGTPMSSSSSVKLLGEECLLHSLQRSPDTFSSSVDGEQRRQRNELAQLEQLYSKKRDIPVQEYANSTHTKQLDAKDDDDDLEMQDYIRHVYFVAVTNTSVSLGITLEGDAYQGEFPTVQDIQDTSPLLDRIFVGDQILAVNNVETSGLCVSKVTKLFLQECTEEESDVAHVIKLTVMSSQPDGSESSLSRDEESSIASERSETKSEL